jgi:hypothetical protein
VEHTLSLAVQIQNAYYCPAITDFFQARYTKSYPEIFNFFEYNIILAILAQYFQTVATFVWNYMNLFIILLSIGISHRFKQLNSVLWTYSGKSVPVQFWVEHRIYYQEICALTARVNKNFSIIILLSISINLFTICVQLLNSVEWVVWHTFRLSMKIKFQWKVFISPCFVLLVFAVVSDWTDIGSHSVLIGNIWWIETTRVDLTKCR